MVRTKSPIKSDKGKTKYKDDFLRQAYVLGKLGLRDEDMADVFKVDVTTIDYWKKNKPDFLRELKRGKREYDSKIVKTLGRRAEGYMVTETEKALVYDKFGRPHTNVKTITKHILPDITAIIFWLKNRQRETWVDVNKTEISGNINHHLQNNPIDFSLCTAEEKALLRSISIKKLSTLNGVSRN